MADRLPLTRDTDGLPEALPSGYNLSAGGGKVVSVGAPTAPNDAVTLTYLQSVASEVIWRANDDITYFDVGVGAPTNGTDGGAGFFDGAYRVPSQRTIQGFALTQQSPGSGGTTTVEVYRVRAGIFFLLATLSVSALTPFDSTTASAPAPSDDVLLSGDYVACRFTSLQTASPPTYPMNVTVQMRAA